MGNENEEHKEKSILGEIEKKAKELSKSVGKQTKQMSEKIKEKAHEIKGKVNDPKAKEVIKVQGENLLEKIKDIIKEGKTRRIVIRDSSGKQILDIPIAVGIVTVILAPYMAILASLIMVGTEYTIEFEKKED